LTVTDNSVILLFYIIFHCSYNLISRDHNLFSATTVLSAYLRLLLSQQKLLKNTGITRSSFVFSE